MARGVGRPRSGRSGQGLVNVPSMVFDPPLEVLIKKFQKVADGLRDFREAWPSVGKAIADINKKNWDSKGAYFGKPWKGHSKKYRKTMKYKGITSAQMLIGKRGELRKQATTLKGLTTRQPMYMKFTIRGPGIRALNYGRKGNKKTGHRTPIPPRAFVGGGKTYVPEVPNKMAEYVREQIRKAGLVTT